jgi:hypothetical protein
MGHCITCTSKPPWESTVHVSTEENKRLKTCQKNISVFGGHIIGHNLISAKQSAHSHWRSAQTLHFSKWAFGFSKRPTSHFISFYPCDTLWVPGEKYISSFFLTFFARSDACPKVRAPWLHLRQVIISGTPPLLERYLTINRRYNVGTLLMWIQLPTTQFDTTIWYKVIELSDVLCYLKGMHCIAFASKATIGIQCPCIKRGEQETIIEGTI